jgi:hypothetical protein
MRPVKSTVACVLALALGGPVFAQQPTTARDTSCSSKLAVAITKSDPASDSVVARCIGQALRDDPPERVLALLETFRDHPRIQRPTSFISGRFSDSFVNWFMNAAFSMWAPANSVCGEDGQLLVLAGRDSGGIRAEILGRPRIEGWTIIRSPGPRFPLATTDPGRPAYLSVTAVRADGAPRRLQDQPLGDGQPIQYVWRPEFLDVDGDGVPEVWVRYNVTLMNGFSQVLEVYRVTQAEALRLEKRFIGASEGVARLLASGTVEIATGFSHGTPGHLEFELHRLEHWNYTGGKWTQTDTTEIPHILWGDEWKKYYGVDGLK